MYFLCIGSRCINMCMYVHVCMYVCMYVCVSAIFFLFFQVPVVCSVEKAANLVNAVTKFVKGRPDSLTSW